jgi:hypothetical protein
MADADREMSAYDCALRTLLVAVCPSEKSEVGEKECRKGFSHKHRDDAPGTSSTAELKICFSL